MTYVAELVFSNLGDSAHGALLDAVAATDAGVFVYSVNNAANYFQNALRASVDANAATNAFVSYDNRMCHDDLSLIQSG